MARRATATATTRTTRKRKAKPKAALKGVNLNVVKMDYAVSDSYGSNAGQLKNAIIYKSSPTTGTIVFACGDTMKVNLKGLAEIIEFLNNGEVQDDKLLSDFMKRRRY